MNCVKCFPCFWIVIGGFLFAGQAGPVEQAFASEVFGGMVESRNELEFCCDYQCVNSGPIPCLDDHDCGKYGAKCIERVRLGLNRKCFASSGPGCERKSECVTTYLTGTAEDCQDIIEIEVPPTGCGMDSCIEGDDHQCGQRTSCGAQ
jgi:hypothetical protein